MVLTGGLLLGRSIHYHATIDSARYRFRPPYGRKMTWRNARARIAIAMLETSAADNIAAAGRHGDA